MPIANACNKGLSSNRQMRQIAWFTHEKFQPKFSTGRVKGEGRIVQKVYKQALFQSRKFCRLQEISYMVSSDCLIHILRTFTSLRP